MRRRDSEVFEIMSGVLPGRSIRLIWVVIAITLLASSIGYLGKS